MINEIATFTATLDAEFKNLGLQPKEGLSIILRPQVKEDGGIVIQDDFEWDVFSKKSGELSGILQKCMAWTKSAWMIDTFKCYDAPYKAIHSCSPFCLAFKRTALEGGETFKKVAADIQRGKTKSQLYDRIDNYFDKTDELLEQGEVELEFLAKAFRDVLNSEEKIHAYLSKTGVFEEMKDGDYIAFYLDTSLDHYEVTHNRYLKRKLFNTEAYNKEDESGEVWGTSNFFNGFGSKKPFLIHQTASFDINGRISASSARHLFEFQNMLGRNVLPRPLPIFILKEELIKGSITIFKREALLDPTERKGHAEIIKELYEDHGDDLGDYYLLYYTGGEIKDFDFVSKFRYKLEDFDGKPWKVQKIMHFGEGFALDNVFDFQRKILPEILNQSLVVVRKDNNMTTRYFEDVDQKYCDNNNAVMYGLVLKYRKAFYDFIYKSKRQSVTAAAFRDILISGILSDVKRDEEHKNTWKISQKLNIWFSLNHHFDPSNSNFNGLDMPSTIPQLMEKMRAVANEGAHFESPEEFAFGAGQVIYFLLGKSQAGNKTHALLEPFTQKTNPETLKAEIARVFDRYKHEVSFGQGRFERLMREVLGYEGAVELRKLLPVMLAGYFSNPVIYENKNLKPEN
jgi:CRISPR-associated protein Csh1